MFKASAQRVVSDMTEVSRRQWGTLEEEATPTWKSQKGASEEVTQAKPGKKTSYLTMVWGRRWGGKGG